MLHRIMPWNTVRTYDATISQLLKTPLWMMGSDAKRNSQ